MISVGHFYLKADGVMTYGNSFPIIVFFCGGNPRVDSPRKGPLIGNFVFYEFYVTMKKLLNQ